ncbi:MAG: hypothetical protein II812_05305 [Prevotella sp.]|nr:hypothetical protein [Prevotella sp.]
MKRLYLLLMLPLLLGACISDDSTYGTDTVNLEISGIEDNYNVISYSGDHLIINPQITTTFDEIDLEYNWAYYDNSRSQAIKYGEEILATNIQKEKNLDYLASFPDGTYTLIFRVTSKSTGVSATKTCTISSASALSKGFFILKEDADGNTDLDLFNQETGMLSTDIIRSYQGEAIPGKPRHLDVNYDMSYLDPETEVANFGNLLSVTTENNEVRWIRALDCRTVMDASNCHYDPVEGEKPYRTIHGYQYTYYLTSNGVYTVFHGQQGGIGTLGTLMGNGASTHAVAPLYTYWGPIYWNEQTRSIEHVNYAGAFIRATSAYPGFSATDTNYDCLACGYCGAVNLSFFLLQDRDNPSQKYVYLVQAVVMQLNPTVVAVIPLNPASHFANAEEYSVNAQSAAVMYCVDENKVYSFGITGATPEKELVFEGLPSNETITYIANRYYTGYRNANDYDYLIVGTQSGNNYNVYMYNMVGGEPVGSPVHVINGTGKLHSIDYITPTNRSPEYYPVLDK